MTIPEDATFHYKMTMFNTRIGQQPKPNQIDFTDAGNGMKIKRDFFNEDSTYLLDCYVSFTVNGIKNKLGFARKNYFSRSFSGIVDFSISPKTGTPFETEFTLTASKSRVAYPIMCDFGYFHPRGKIVLPSEDTIDNL